MRSGDLGPVELGILAAFAAVWLLLLAVGLGVSVYLVRRQRWDSHAWRAIPTPPDATRDRREA